MAPEMQRKMIHGLYSLKWGESHSVVSNSLPPHGLYSQWNSPGQNTGVGSLSLLQGMFPIQGSNPGLPHCERILYQLSHKGCPRILEWVAYPFSRESCWPRNWTRVSCIAGRFFLLTELLGKPLLLRGPHMGLEIKKQTSFPTWQDEIDLWKRE